LDIRALSYFVAVVNEGTITAAAQTLHMSQPPLSTQIQLLEQELGVILFDRSTRHMKLTETGRVLYERACDLLDMCTSIQNEMADRKTGSIGTVRLGVISSICNTMFQKWLRQFCTTHDKVKFELYEANTYQLLDKVRSNQIEIAFVRTPFTASDLRCIHLQSEPLCAIGQPEFFSAAGSKVQLLQLASAPLLFYRRWERILLDAFQEAGLCPRTFCISDDARTIVSMAQSGFGIGIVPQSVIPPGMEVRKIIDYPKFHSEICAVHRKDMYISSAAQQFLDQIQADCVSSFHSS